MEQATTTINDPLPGRIDMGKLRLGGHFSTSLTRAAGPTFRDVSTTCACSSSQIKGDTLYIAYQAPSQLPEWARMQNERQCPVVQYVTVELADLTQHSIELKGLLTLD